MQTNQTAKSVKSLFIPVTGMNPTLSKVSILLILLTNISPVLAVSKTQNPALQQQAFNQPIKSSPIVVAGFLDKPIFFSSFFAIFATPGASTAGNPP